MKSKLLRRFVITTTMLVITALVESCTSIDSDTADLPDFIQKSVRDLHSHDASVRGDAAYRLGELKVGKAAPAIARLLVDEKSYYCGYDPSGHVLMCTPAFMAAEALVSIGSDAIDPLSIAVRYPDSMVRQRAAYALAQIEDPRAIPPTLRALHDPDNRVRGTAAGMLRQTDERLLDTLVQILRHDPSDEVRWEASKQMWSYSDNPSALKPLIAALSDRYSGVQEEAVTALRRVKDPLALKAMIEVLDDEERGSGVRTYAALNMGEYSDEASFAALLRATKSADWGVRDGAFRALGQRRDARAVSALIAGLSSEHLSERADAAEALGLIGDARATGALQKLESDFQPVVRQKASAALKKIDERERGRK